MMLAVLMYISFCFSSKFSCKKSVALFKIN